MFGLGLLTSSVLGKFQYELNILPGFGLPDDKTDTENKFYAFLLIFPSIIAFINLFFFVFVFREDSPKNYVEKNGDFKSKEMFTKACKNICKLRIYHN